MISRPAWLVRQELCLGLPVPCSLINMRKGIPVSGITADASLPTSAAPFLKILHEDGVVPPGLGLKSGCLPSAEQLAEKFAYSQNVGLCGQFFRADGAHRFPSLCWDRVFVVARTHFGPALTAPESASATGADCASP